MSICLGYISSIILMGDVMIYFWAMVVVVFLIYIIKDIVGDIKAKSEGYTSKRTNYPMPYHNSNTSLTGEIAVKAIFIVMGLLSLITVMFKA